MTVVNTVVMLIGFPIYLHFLGYDKYGVWLVLATVLTFAQLGDLGIGQAVIKLVAEEYGRGDIEGIQRYVTTALALLCLSGTAALVVILALKNQIIAAFNLSNENAEMVSWLLPYIGILSIYVFVVQVLNGTLSGLGRMDLANYIQSVGRVFAVTIATVLLYRGRGIESLLIGSTLSYVFYHIVSVICIRRIACIRLLRIGNLDTQCGKHILSFGGAVFGGTLVSMLGVPFHKLMLARYAGVSTLPIYEIAFNGAMQFRGLIEAGFQALMPETSRVAAKITSQSIDRMTVLNRRAMKLIIVVGVPMYAVMLIFATPLIRIWLREEFIQIIPSAFRIMLIASFVSLLGVPSYYFLLGMGRVRNVFVSRCISWLSNMALIALIAITTKNLSVHVVFMCLIVSWFLSSTYIIWLFRSAMRNYERIVSSKEDPKSNNISRYVGSVS